MATVNILNQGFYATMDSQHDVLDNYPKNHKTKHQAEECHELSEQGPLTQKQEIETKHSNTTTTILLNIASGLDGCDDQLLPASFRVMEAELGFHPSLLGHITFGQILASSLSCPFWVYFSDRYSRKLLIIIGLLSWGTATIGLGFASTLSNVVVLRLINGIFLGSIGPVCQSILADMCHSTTRGYYFGMIQMCSSGGRVIGGVLMTSIAFMYFYRYRGWRWTFFFVGGLSIFLGIVIAFFFPEQNRSKYHKLNAPPTGLSSSDQITYAHNNNAVRSSMSSTSSSKVTTTLSKNPIEQKQKTPSNIIHSSPDSRQTLTSVFKDVIYSNFKKFSILLILVEGVTGMISWSALAFITLYFQYQGLTDAEAGIAACFLHIGAMISGPFAGILGDIMSQHYPYHGRLVLAQLSMLFRVPFAVLAFFFLPTFYNTFWIYCSVCFILGTFCVGGVVINRPVLAELVLPSHRATVFSIIIALEGSIGSFIGVSLMGVFTEYVFGYVRTSNLLLQDISLDVKKKNADALGYSLLCLTCIPWTLSCLCYSILHFTYKNDKLYIQKYYSYWDNYFKYFDSQSDVPMQHTTSTQSLLTQLLDPISTRPSTRSLIY